LIVVAPNNIEESERDALKRLTSLVKERDPDVIEGHNLFRFDLPYLVNRAKKLKTKLDWDAVTDSCVRGRHDSKSPKKQSIIQSSQLVRHFVDTFCSRNFMTSACVLLPVSKGPMSPGISISATAKKLQRSRQELQRAYLGDSEIFRRRALCGVRETRALSNC